MLEGRSAPGLLPLEGQADATPPPAAGGLPVGAAGSADQVATQVEIDRDLAPAWHWAADPHAPLTGIPGVSWTPLEVTVRQVYARSRRG